MHCVWKDLTKSTVLKNQIAIAKENKNLTKEEQNKIIGECKKNLEKAKATEDANKQQIAKLIAERRFSFQTLQQ